MSLEHRVDVRDDAKKLAVDGSVHSAQCLLFFFEEVVHILLFCVRGGGKNNDPCVMASERALNPLVYIEVESFGRMTFELRADIVPKTSERFRSWCSEKTLKGSRLCRIVPHSHCQGGGFVVDTEGHREDVRDENFLLRHTGPGVLSLCNRGPDTNGTSFFVHFAENPRFDEKHVVFGCCSDEKSLGVLFEIEKNGKDVLVTECGEISRKSSRVLCYLRSTTGQPHGTRTLEVEELEDSRRTSSMCSVRSSVKS